MKKLFLLAIVATLSTGVFAQTSTTTPTKKEERKDFKQDTKDYKQDKKELRRDVKNGDKDAAAKVRSDMQADRKDMRGDAKAAGIKHPRKRINRRHH